MAYLIPSGSDAKQPHIEVDVVVVFGLGRWVGIHYVNKTSLKSRFQELNRHGVGTELVVDTLQSISDWSDNLLG
jgi:hypothetical protein